MKLALECRVDLLELVQPFADFDFLLTHEALGNEAYLEHYKKSAKWKIIDNSVNEEDEPSTIEELKEVFDEVEADFVISPDWIGEADSTRRAYLQCIEVFGEGKVIGVIQGKTFEEALLCLNTYKGMVAVPYDICSKRSDPPWVMSLRRALVVCNIPSEVPVHLLGFTSIDELIYYEGRTNVGSIDTGAPILLGLDSKDILDPIESKIKATYNLMEGKRVTPETWTAICRNIALLRRYLP